MRVAVVGSGLAGLTAAYLLVRQGVEVVLLEKSDKLGFHAESVEIPLDGQSEGIGGESGKSDQSDKSGKHRRWVVDVPMRGFQGGYYPLLLTLYHHLSLPLTAKHYTFSFTSSARGTYFIHSGASGLALPSLPSTCLASPRAFFDGLIAFLGAALSYLLFLALSFLAWHSLAPSHLASPSRTLRNFTITLSSFLAEPVRIPLLLTSYTPQTPLGVTFESFISTLVLPLFSAVGTMTSTDVWETPIPIILDYIHKTFGTAHYHLGQGLSAADVARRLAEPVESQGDGHVKLGAEIESIVYGFGGELSVRLKRKRPDETRQGWAGAEAGDQAREEEEEIKVDKVVLATQASVACHLLEGLEASMKEYGEEKERRRVERMRLALAGVAYRETIVVTHRDYSILPPQADRRDINLFLPTSSSSPSTPISTQVEGDNDINSPIPYFRPSQGVYAMATQIIPPPLGVASQPVLQTTNPVLPIDARKVLSVSRLERALPLRHPSSTLAALRPSYPHTNAKVYLVGSYAYPGIPLLEGCVGSAKLVIEEIVGKDRFASDRSAWLKRGSSGDGGVGGVDWNSGNGSLLGRAWRWRWSSGSII